MFWACKVKHACYCKLNVPFSRTPVKSVDDEEEPAVTMTRGFEVSGVLQIEAIYYMMLYSHI